MKLLRNAVAFVVVLGLAFALAAQADAQDKKKKKGKAVVGVVVEVKDDTITVKTGAKKKKGKVVSEGKEHKFTISDKTKIAKAGNKKKKIEATEAKLSDIQKGTRVRVVAGADGAARQIAILPSGGKKKKKNADG